MNNFIVEPLSITFKKLGITEVEWRRNLIKQITGGDVYDFKEGFITIEVPALRFQRTLYASNVSKRLDLIIHQLISGGEGIPSWIVYLHELNNHLFTIEEIEQIRFTVSKENVDLKVSIKQLLKQLPKKERGGYEIKFPNGKIYYNISKDIKSQIQKHLNGIFYKPTLKWHEVAASENLNLKTKDLEISYTTILEESKREEWKQNYDSKAASHKEDFYC